MQIWRSKKLIWLHTRSTLWGGKGEKMYTVHIPSTRPVVLFGMFLKEFLKIFEIENFQNLVIFGFLIRGFNGAYRCHFLWFLNQREFPHLVKKGSFFDASHVNVSWFDSKVTEFVFGHEARICCEGDRASAGRCERPSCRLDLTARSFNKLQSSWIHAATARWDSHVWLADHVTTQSSWSRFTCPWWPSPTDSWAMLTVWSWQIWIASAAVSFGNSRGKGKTQVTSNRCPRSCSINFLWWQIGPQAPVLLKSTLNKKR